MSFVVEVEGVAVAFVDVVQGVGQQGGREAGVFGGGVAVVALDACASPQPWVLYREPKSMAASLGFDPWSGKGGAGYGQMAGCAPQAGDGAQ